MSQSLSMLTFMLSSKSAQFLRYMDLRTPTNEVCHPEITLFIYRKSASGLWHYFSLFHNNYHTPVTLWVTKVGEAAGCNFLTDSCKFPSKKLVLKSIKNFQFEFSYEFSYFMCRKVIWNLQIQHICLHEQIVLQRALGYNVICSVHDPSFLNLKIP